MRYYLRNKKIKKRDNITLRRIFYLFIYIFLSNYHEISLEIHGVITHNQNALFSKTKNKKEM
jgi:hypothetical protein